MPKIMYTYIIFNKNLQIKDVSKIIFTLIEAYIGFSLSNTNNDSDVW